MEEGPEAHELVEQTVEHQHHTESGPAHDHHPNVVGAMTAAVLAVLAAFSSLLSGHAATEAVILQTRAADTWAEFQAESVKGHVYALGSDMVAALASTADAKQVASTSLKHFQEQSQKYDEKKQKLKESAEELQEESRRELGKHKYYSMGVVAFQTGVVLASISLLVRSRALYSLSWLAAACGCVMNVFGALA
jgi:hypothetical protein